VNMPMPSPVLPEQLMRLIARNGGASFGEEKSGAIRGVPPRPMEEVASLVLKGDFVDIRPLEWALLLRSGNVWEHSEASALATQVCIAANSNASLEHKLSIRFADAMAGNKRAMAGVLRNAVHHYQFRGRFQKRWKLLQNLDKGKVRMVADELANRNKETVQEGFDAVGAPAWQPLVLKVAVELPDAMFRHAAFRKRDIAQANREHMGRWLIRSMEALSVEDMIKVADRLAGAFRREGTQVVRKWCAELIEWLAATIGPGAHGNAWAALKDESRNVFAELFGKLRYQDFSRMVDMIAGHIASLPSTEENQRQTKQLQSRKLFWMHYSNHFLQIRLLAPKSTHDQLKQDFGNMVELLTQDGSPESEVCILETERFIIVEFMRGRGSETRFFLPTKANRKCLMEGRLGCKRIRSMQSAKVHDHAFLWQGELIQWLHNHGMQPNPDVTHFKGVKRGHNRYDRKSGRLMEPPSADDLRQRKEGVEFWRKTIARL